MKRAIYGLVALGLLMPAGAQAGPYYEWQYVTKEPQKGYSGFAGISVGRRNLYCDYIRVPNRECITLKSGKERCKITSWTLKQTCQ